MLKVSEVQLAALGRSAQAQLEPRVLAYLRDKHPRFCAAAGERLPAFFSSALRFARMSGLDSELAVVTICELVAIYGPHFHQAHAWAAYILADSDAHAGERVARLREYLPREATDNG